MRIALPCFCLLRTHILFLFSHVRWIQHSLCLLTLAHLFATHACESYRVGQVVVTSLDMYYCIVGVRRKVVGGKSQTTLFWRTAARLEIRFVCEGTLLLLLLLLFNVVAMWWSAEQQSSATKVTVAFDKLVPVVLISAFCLRAVTVKFKFIDRQSRKQCTDTHADALSPDADQLLQ